MLLRVCLVFLLGYAQAKLSLVKEFEQLEALYSPERNDNLLRADPATRKLRFSTFVNSKKEIEKINKDPTKTFIAGLTKFALLTPGERQRHMGINMTLNSPEYKMNMESRDDPDHSDGFGLSEEIKKWRKIRNKFYDSPVPESVDWTYTQQPIKDQGSCGSCWAFAFVSMLEGTYAITTGDKINMAEQEILECSTKAFNCERGGLFNMPVEYVKLYQRIGGTDEIPYTATYSGVCDYRKRKAKNVLTKAKLTEMRPIYNGDRNLEKILAHTVVGVLMTVHGDLMYYKEGNYEEPFAQNCPTHAATLVGYGTNEWGKYWKLRNSWGEGWGQGGYGYFSREFEGNSYFSREAVWLTVVPHVEGEPLRPPAAPFGLCEDDYGKNRNGCPELKTQGMCEEGSQYYDFMMIKCRGTCEACKKGIKTYYGAGYKGPEFYARNKWHPFENGIPDENEEEKEEEEDKEQDEINEEKDEDEEEEQDEMEDEEEEDRDEEKDDEDSSNVLLNSDKPWLSLKKSQSALSNQKSSTNHTGITTPFCAKTMTIPITRVGILGDGDTANQAGKLCMPFPWLRRNPSPGDLCVRWQGVTSLPSRDESKIRQQDTRLVLMYVSMGGYQANYETWNFVRENWEYFYETFGHTNSGFDILLESVIGQFYKKEDIDEVVKFFANKSDLGSLQRGVKKGLEAANHRLDWMGEHRANAGGWFKSNYGPGSISR
eukprot:sb/3462554/